MRRWDMAGGNSKCLAMGAAVLLALAGCSTKANDTDMTPGGAMGAGTTGAVTNAGTMATATSGTGAMVGGSGTGSQVGPQAGAPGDVSNPQAGSGENTAGSMAMPTGGTGEDPMETAGTGSETPMGTCDTSTFMTDCKQGGEYWGTPTQAGPCKSGETVYGVKAEFGPYGVRSVYNVGQGFESDGTADPAGCSLFIDSFGADPVGSADLKDTHDLDFALYTIFYPGCMPEGETFPVITWGNGTCAMPEGYGPLLRYVASFGYIVVAANSVQVASIGSPMTKALDFMFAENEKMGSEFYHKMDLEKVGAMGHSQGGGATVSAAEDPRIKAVILWNGGSSASKPFLSVSGDLDLFSSVSSYRNAAENASVPAAWLWYHQIPQEVNGSTTGATAAGHLTLMMESERVQDATVAWWDLILKKKDSAKAMFLGDNCTLCDPNAFPSRWMPVRSGSSATPSIEYGHNAMLQ